MVHFFPPRCHSVCASLDVFLCIFFILLVGAWSPNWVYSARRPVIGLLYLPRVIVMMERIWWNENWQGKPKNSEKTYPGATLSTKNPTWPDPGSNPGRRRGKPATNRLSYGAALPLHLLRWSTWQRRRAVEMVASRPDALWGEPNQTDIFSSFHGDEIVALYFLYNPWKPTG
jgi:hypothetical protein